MTNKAAWAYVAGTVREFSITEYPVILGLNRILRRMEGFLAPKAVQNAGRNSQRAVNSGTKLPIGVSAGASGVRVRGTKPGTKYGTKSLSAGESKRTAATAWERERARMLARRSRSLGRGVEKALGLPE